MRAGGVLLPVASLPSKHGIGAFSREAYEFVDMLEKGGQKYWQILPLGPTGYGDSPYQSFSTYAGNPYFIDLESLCQEGLLTREEVEAFDFGQEENLIDYKKIYDARFLVLRKAFERSDWDKDGEYQDFKRGQNWLFDYSLYMAVKNSFKGVSWIEWDQDIRFREPDAMEAYRERYKDEIEFYSYLQFLFWKQWMKLKSYANGKGIQIIGDIPIYVAFDSADTWSNPKMFQFDEELNPVGVAGCPPDGFSATGQLWGNPLYRWEYHRETGYSWWIQRIAHCFRLYDVVRIDHFRGFDQYYSIPFGDATAEYGHWEEGPGLSLFQAIKDKLGELPVIAEDLGFLTPSVLKLVADTGYPGMKVLEFAFDSREESDYLPHNYSRNCVVYTGTHDNQTVKAWFEEMNDHDRCFAMDYLDIRDKKKEDIPWCFIRSALSSVADLAVIPIQDYLGLGAEARINTPSTLGGNWQWRLKKGEFTLELAEQMRRLAGLYGRL